MAKKNISKLNEEELQPTAEVMADTQVAPAPATPATDVEVAQAVEEAPQMEAPVVETEETVIEPTTVKKPQTFTSPLPGYVPSGWVKIEDLASAVAQETGDVEVAGLSKDATTEEGEIANTSETNVEANSDLVLESISNQEKEMILEYRKYKEAKLKEEMSEYDVAKSAPESDERDTDELADLAANVEIQESEEDPIKDCKDGEPCEEMVEATRDPNDPWGLLGKKKAMKEGTVIDRLTQMDKDEEILNLEVGAKTAEELIDANEKLSDKEKAFLKDYIVEHEVAEDLATDVAIEVLDFPQIIEVFNGKFPFDEACGKKKAMKEAMEEEVEEEAEEDDGAFDFEDLRMTDEELDATDPDYEGDPEIDAIFDEVAEEAEAKFNFVAETHTDDKEEAKEDALETIKDAVDFLDDLIAEDEVEESEEFEDEELEEDDLEEEEIKESRVACKTPKKGGIATARKAHLERVKGLNENIIYPAGSAPESDNLVRSFEKENAKNRRALREFRQNLKRNAEKIENNEFRRALGSSYTMKEEVSEDANSWRNNRFEEKFSEKSKLDFNKLLNEGFLG